MEFLKNFSLHHTLEPLPEESAHPVHKEVITVSGAWFRYEEDSPDVVKGLDLTLRVTSAFAGVNGAGKDTTLKLLSDYGSLTGEM